VIKLDVTVDNRLLLVGAMIEEKVDYLTREAANFGVRDAKARAPVDTGELQSKIAAERKGRNEYQIVSRAEHSVYVEFGTVFTPAQPFMTPMAAVVASKYGRSMRGIV
jgi:HK97 gp10 family phage protein